MAERLVIHIGAPKSGSTYLQRLMRSHRDALGVHGVTLPGPNQRFHFAVGNDLLGTPGTFVDRVRQGPGEHGLDHFMAKVTKATAPVAVLTDERLAGIPADGLARLAAVGRDLPIRVVYVARNLLSAFPSAWQMQVRHGEVNGLDDWVEGLLAEDPAKSDSWFWRVHYLPAVLDRWLEVAGDPERVRVVTLPPASAEPLELWRRFAAAAAIDYVPQGWDAVMPNPSLDYDQVELLRRLNQHLGESLPPGVYRRLVRGMLSSQVMTQAATGTKPSLAKRHEPQAAAIASDIAERLAAGPFAVLGDIADLTAHRGEDESAPQPTDPEILERAVETIGSLLKRLARNQEDSG